MKIIEFFFRNWGALFVTIIAVFSCKTCAGDYIEGSDEEKIAQYETMIKENTKTTAVYDSVYTKHNPSVHDINPASSLKYEKEKETSNTNLYFAIFWGVLALILAVGLWIQFKEFKEEYKI